MKGHPSLGVFVRVAVANSEAVNHISACFKSDLGHHSKSLV